MSDSCYPCVISETLSDASHQFMAEASGDKAIAITLCSRNGKTESMFLTVGQTLTLVAKLMGIMDACEMLKDKTVERRVIRKWINQPSVTQTYHGLHGKRVLYDPKNQEIWFTDGNIVSQMIDKNALSEGWPDRA